MLLAPLTQQNLNLPRQKNEPIHYRTHHHLHLFCQQVYFQKFLLKTVDSKACSATIFTVGSLRFVSSGK